MKKISNPKNISSHKHLLFAGIGSVFFILGISIFATNFSIITSTDQYINHQTNQIPSKVPHFINNDIKQQKIQQLLQDRKYQQALKQIENKKPEDYFNRGVILLEQAIDYSKSTQLDKLKNAKYLSEKAIDNFKIAQKIQINSQLSSYIAKNITIAENIYNINIFKFCFAGNETIIDQIQTFQQETKNLLKILQTERKVIQQHQKTLDKISTSCTDKLLQLNHKNQQNIQQLERILANSLQQYTQKYIHTLQNPKLCSQENLSPIIDSIDPTKNTLQEYKQNHEQVLSNIKNKNIPALKTLCQESKNDSQIQSNISHTMQSFLEKIQQNSNNPNWNNPNTTNTQHKNINKIKPNIKKQINEKNIERIHEIQNITKHNYNPLQQIKDLFKEFYGNTKDYKQYFNHNKYN